MLKARLDQDLKTALLAGDRILATTLRGLKSVILYDEVAKGSRDKGLSDDEIIELFVKEAKKRQESADLYMQGGDEARAQAELAEKQVIGNYLPAQLSEEELSALVDEAIKDSKMTGPPAMGPVIGLVKQKVAGKAEGARIAAMVKQRME